MLAAMNSSSPPNEILVPETGSSTATPYTPSCPRAISSSRSLNSCESPKPSVAFGNGDDPSSTLGLKTVSRAPCSSSVPQTKSKTKPATKEANESESTWARVHLNRFRTWLPLFPVPCAEGLRSRSFDTTKNYLRGAYQHDAPPATREQSRSIEHPHSKYSVGFLPPHMLWWYCNRYPQNEVGHFVVGSAGHKRTSSFLHLENDPLASCL